MNNLKTTRSFKIPADIEMRMNKKLVADGYGLRGKSKWICDAITEFLNSSGQSFILECIEYADELSNLNKSISFRSTEEVNQLLDKWIVKVRQVMPTMEGVKSKIIRTSIIQGIIGSALTLNEVYGGSEFANANR